MSEFPVDVAIVPSVFGAEHRACVCDVAEQPDTLIGEPVIEAAFLFLRQPYAPQRVLGMIRRHADMITGVHGVAVGIARALCDPGSVAGTQDGFQGGCQAAGRHHALDTACVMSM